MKKILALFSIAFLMIFSGCSGAKSANGGGGNSIIPPVQASPGYTNATIAGTYAYSFELEGSEQTLYGTFTSDGNGNLTSGIMNVAHYTFSVPTQCAYTFTGTYSIKSDGTGSSTWNPTPSATSPCSSTYFATASFHLVIAQQGAAIQFAGDQGVIQGVQGNGSAFTALKQ
ncbi:MAG TPA: hypothetical protein VFE38_10530 [Edaphobacter sp.]|nr:hypothetical protein [Edaphobacter sp.]